LEDFAHTVYVLALDGYEKCEDDALEDIATEAFLRGCKEKEAAIKAMEKNPVTLSKAIKFVKTSLANQKAILGQQKISWFKDKLPFQIQKVLTLRKRKTVICKDKHAWSRK
jgi:5'(3')-deoxyribonucleotidase